MIDKEEVFSTKTPSKNIRCKDCKHRLKDLVIQGEKIVRYTYGECAAFKNKPAGVLWNGEDCELYSKE